MKIAFYGGETAGCIALLALLAKKSEVVCVYAEDKKVETIAQLYTIPLRSKNAINAPEELSFLKQNTDLLVCCHARKILNKKLVETIKAINLHPCLYKYKGGYPIQRLIAEKNPKASVACHWMIEAVDAGETIREEFITIENIEKRSEAEVYNFLYPLYAKVLLESLQILATKVR